MSPIFKTLQRICNSPYFLWLLLAVPSYPLILEVIFDNRHYPELMHTTGTFSSHLLVIILSITPLMFLTKRWQPVFRIVQWFARRRRYLGVAAFVYAALHTLLYLHDTWDLEEVLVRALDFEMAVGWIGFLVLIPLALTSNDTSVRLLGPKWKTIQRLAYVAAICAFVHWVIFDFLLNEVLGWFIPLALLQIYRIGYRYSHTRKGNISRVKTMETNISN